MIQTNKNKSNKNITLFLIANFITYLGNGIQILGAAYIAFNEVNSIFAIASVFLSYAIPQLFASYFSLGILRRFGVKIICQYSDIARGVFVLCIFIAVFLQKFVIETTLIVTAISSLMDGLYQPASNSFFQKIIKQGQLNTEIFSSKLEISTQIAMLISVTIGAFIGHLLGVEIIFLINGLSFFASSILFYFINGKFSRESKITISSTKLYVKALRYNFIDILNFSLVRAVPNVMNSLTIFFVIAVAGENFAILGIVDAIASLGFMFGSMFFIRFLSSKNIRKIVIFSLGLTSIFIFLQPIYEIYFMSLMFFFATFTFGISRIAARVSMIERIVEEDADSVYSMANILGLFFAIILTLLICWVQPIFGIIAAYFVVAIFVAIVAFIVTMQKSNIN